MSHFSTTRRDLPITPMLSKGVQVNKVKTLGFNQKQIYFLQHHPWWDAQRLYLSHYSEQFTDEYNPYAAGLKDLDLISVSDLLKKENASDAFIECNGSSRSRYMRSGTPASYDDAGCQHGPHKSFA